jgi:hypothetical protein
MIHSGADYEYRIVLDVSLSYSPVSCLKGPGVQLWWADVAAVHSAHADAATE